MAAFVLLAPSFIFAGDVTGRVTLKGTPPQEKTIVMDEDCSKLHPEPVTTRHYVVGTNGGLANVFVYISKGLEGQTFAPPAEPANLNQIGGMVRALRAGRDGRTETAHQKL